MPAVSQRSASQRRAERGAVAAGRGAVAGERAERRG